MIKLLLLFILGSCETIRNRYYENFCFQLHRTPDIYKVEKVENTRVHLIRLKSGEKKLISSMDRGWYQVECEFPNQRIPN